MGGPEPGRIRVIRVPEDGHVRVRVGHFVRLHPGEIADHEVGRVDALRRGEPMDLAEKHVELPSKEQVDPDEQDRGHERSVPARTRSRKGLC